MIPTSPMSSIDGSASAPTPSVSSEQPEDDQAAAGAFRKGRHTDVNTERPDFSSTCG